MSILQSFIAGQEARRQADAAAEVNRMQQFLSQNGQAIFQGDQNALGQLAGFGAQGLDAAMSLRQQQDARAAAQAEQARAGVIQGRQDQEWRMKLEEYAASKTAAERAAEAAEIEQGVKIALSAQTPEEFDAIVTQNGMPEYAGKFEQRNQLAARFMSVADILKQNAPPDPMKGAPTGYTWSDPANPAAGVVPLPGYEKSSGVTINTGDLGGAAPQIGTIPQGYVAVPDPQSPAGYTMMPIPGGPEDTSGKDARKNEQGQLKLGTTLESLNLNIADLENGGMPVAGIGGDIRRTIIGRAFTGDSAVDFGNRTAQITDSAALAEVQNMRDNSPTGGAVGSLTDDERRAIGNAVTGINNSTSPEEYLRAAKAFRELALDLAYGQGAWEMGADGQIALKDTNAAPPPAGAASSPAPEAVDILRQNDTPEYRKFFDDVFGPGAAERALGGN
jgi:hypothetical protein